jgi:hypothetical protein
MMVKANHDFGENRPEQEMTVINSPIEEDSIYLADTPASREWEKRLDADFRYQDEGRQISANIKGGIIVATLVCLVLTFGLASKFNAPLTEKLSVMALISITSIALVVIDQRQQ